MTERQKVAHLLRRLSFGASPREMDTYGAMRWQDVRDRLLNFSLEDNDIHPYRFCFFKEGEADPGGHHIRLYWLYRMVTTEQPLREKLALFWHSHFAASEAQVADGLAMLAYLQDLRRLGGGKFGDLLSAMALSPAVMKMLDVRLMSRSRPNENFARELLELYTLGEGHYSERDIKEIARAFTGWGTIETYYEQELPHAQKLETAFHHGREYTVAAYAAQIHDDGPKEILGAKLEGAADVVKHLAKHPRTAELICGKLWAFFAYENPTADVLQPVISAFRKSQGDIRTTVRAITDHPEFWGEKSVRQLVKSPIDLIIGLYRTYDVRAEFERHVKPGEEWNKPIPKRIFDVCGGLAYYTHQAGQSLLYPPDVAGWPGGQDWISSQAMVWRNSFYVAYTWEEYEEKGTKKWRPGDVLLAFGERVKARKPTTIEELAFHYLDLFDCELDPTQTKLFIDFLGKNGELKALAANAWLAGQVSQVTRFLRSAPAFHVA